MRQLQNSSKFVSSENCAGKGQPNNGSSSHANFEQSGKKLSQDSCLRDGSDLTESHLSTSHFSALFVLRSSQPPILHAHLPQLVAAASLARPECEPTRLVQLPKGSDARVCTALGIPRVSFIGILEGAPNAKSLIDLVEESVSKIDIPWMKEIQEAKYRPVKINAIETFATIKNKSVTK